CLRRVSSESTQGQPPESAYCGRTGSPGSSNATTRPPSTWCGALWTSAEPRPYPGFWPSRNSSSAAGQRGQPPPRPGRSPATSSANCKPSTRPLTFAQPRSEEHTSELQSRENLVCRLL